MYIISAGQIIIIIVIVCTHFSGLANDCYLEKTHSVYGVNFT